MKNPFHDSKVNPFWDSISTNHLVRFLLLFCSGWAVIAIIEYFQEIFFVFSVASILAFCLNYPVRYLEQYLGRGLARGIVIFLSLLIVMGVLAGLVLYALYQLQQLSNSLIVNLENLNFSAPSWQQIQTFLAQRNINIDLRSFVEMLTSQITSAVIPILNLLTLVPSTLLGLILILVVAFFMLTDGERLWHLLIMLIPQQERQRVEKAIQQSFIGFFRGQLLLCLSLGTLSFLAFLLLQISNAFALAIIVAILDTIPGIGATLGVIIITSITIVQGGWIDALKVVGVSILLQQIQDNLISPKIMQSSVNLNPVVVFFALMVGAKIAGLFGIFFSVPIAGVIVNFLKIEQMQSEN